MSAERFDAVVVGAGPAGSATAILLADSGWSVALVERQAFPRRKVCGECVAASNLGLLDALGVGDAFAAAAGAPLRRVALMRGDAVVETTLPASDDAAHPWGRALGREHLDPMLVDAARRVGVQIVQPAALQRVDGGPGAYRLSLHDGETAGSRRELTAGVVVAAHGSWQPLPAERAVRPPRRPDDLYAFKASFRAARITDGCLPVLSFRGGYGGMVTEGGGVATIACCIRDDRLAEARVRSPGGRAGDAVEALLRRECAGVARALDGATRDGGWLAAGPIRPGVRLGHADDRDAPFFRVGNAAGEAHPIVGEGISMALQGAFVLASVIAGERAALLGGEARTSQRAALARYEALWRRRFAIRLGVAAAFAHAAMRPELSPLLVVAVRAWPGLLTHGAAWSGKTRRVPEAARFLAPALAHAAERGA